MAAKKIEDVIMVELLRWWEHSPNPFTILVSGPLSPPWTATTMAKFTVLIQSTPINCPIGGLWGITLIGD